MNENNVARAVHDLPRDAEELLGKLDAIGGKIAALQRRHQRKLARLSARRARVRRALRWPHGCVIPPWAEPESELAG